jgi:hypothetical protein
LAFIRPVPDSEDWKYCMEKGLIKNKLEFIHNKFPAINFSRMSDEQYHELEKISLKELITHRRVTLANVISSKFSGKYRNDESIYTFSIKCPFCGEESMYSYAPSQREVNSLYSIIFCKNCYKKLKIPNREAFGLSYFFTLKMSMWLFYWCNLKKYRIISEAAKLGKKYGL